MKALSADPERPRPQVIENYHDFTPPRWLKGVIEDALSSVPERYLAGLKTVVLANKTALTRDQRRQKIWSRKKKYQLAEARGAYYAATRSRPASVWIYVDNILRPLPTWFVRAPMLAVMEIAGVLFHGIGHHIHTVHKPIYEGKENVAEYWDRRLSRSFSRRRYWYARPLLYPLGIAVRLAEKIKKRISRGGQRTEVGPSPPGTHSSYLVH